VSAFYNEHDKQAANWLRELIHEGHIPPGDVDERSIRDVSADDLRGYDQCHFFAGIGVWGYALRCAGWDDARPVGTGSCPCQPFSAAGKQAGEKDPRHLWPDLHRIIRDARQQGQRWADCFFGEQAPTAGEWIDLVRSDLEALGYAFGSPDIPAAGFGGAHIRQRFYWVADAHNAERWADLAPRNIGDWPSTGRVQGSGHAAERGAPGGMGHTHDQRGHGSPAGGEQAGWREPSHAGSAGRVADTPSIGWRQEHSNPGRLLAGNPAQGRTARPGDGCGDSDWIACRDGLWRPVEPGTSPLATAAPARLGRLRGYGNALDGETATQFVAAYMGAAGINERLAA